ncbi:MAG: hypothetical protein AAGF82_05555 [Pseudomonadota bacterium]
MAQTFFRILLFIIALDVILIALKIFTPFLASKTLTDHAWKFYGVFSVPMLALMVTALIKEPSKMPFRTFAQKVFLTAFVLLISVIPGSIFLHLAPYFYTLHFHEEAAEIFRVKSVDRTLAGKSRFSCRNSLRIESQPLLGSRLCVDAKTSRIVEHTIEHRGYQSCGILVTGRSSRYGIIPDSVHLVDPKIERPCYVRDLK